MVQTHGDFRQVKSFLLQAGTTTCKDAGSTRGSAGRWVHPGKPHCHRQHAYSTGTCCKTRTSSHFSVTTLVHPRVAVAHISSSVVTRFHWWGSVFLLLDVFKARFTLLIAMGDAIHFEGQDNTQSTYSEIESEVGKAAPFKCNVCNRSYSRVDHLARKQLWRSFFRCFRSSEAFRYSFSLSPNQNNNWRL